MQSSHTLNKLHTCIDDAAPPAGARPPGDGALLPALHRLRHLTTTAGPRKLPGLTGHARRAARVLPIAANRPPPRLGHGSNPPTTASIPPHERSSRPEIPASVDSG
jgi:hypothetical protein